VKIFISWSGETSKEVAIVLRDWLPSVIQSILPYVSSEDINKGVRWSSDISGQLDSTSFGIICLTPENLDAPWIHFEAGALSKAVDKSRVAPFLLGVKTSEVRGPLVQFQSTLFTKEEVKKLVLSINASEEVGSRLDEARLITCFEVWWPQLEGRLKAIEGAIPNKDEKAHRPTAEQRAEIIEEMLVLLRTQQKQLSDPATLLPPEYLRQIIRGAQGHPRHDHPVYRDLSQTWRSINKALDSLPEDETLSASEMKILLRELESPIKYIVRNTDLMPRVRSELNKLKVVAEDPSAS
jgi:hypothetical protein